MPASATVRRCKLQPATAAPHTDALARHIHALLRKGVVCMGLFILAAAELVGELSNLRMPLGVVPIPVHVVDAVEEGTLWERKLAARTHVELAHLLGGDDLGFTELVERLNAAHDHVQDRALINGLGAGDEHVAIRGSIRGAGGDGERAGGSAEPEGSASWTFVVVLVTRGLVRTTGCGGEEGLARNGEAGLEVRDGKGRRSCGWPRRAPRCAREGRGEHALMRHPVGSDEAPELCKECVLVKNRRPCECDQGHVGGRGARGKAQGERGRAPRGHGLLAVRHGAGVLEGPHLSLSPIPTRRKHAPQGHRGAEDGVHLVRARHAVPVHGKDLRGGARHAEAGDELLAPLRGGPRARLHAAAA
mmetsp:Transcript_19439/g.52297  ORF Transcript_19439/g.52297 Transcript_19439/m.52297 type:complete len:361 (-) Transcript_19439:3278-4360(-)